MGFIRLPEVVLGLILFLVYPTAAHVLSPSTRLSPFSPTISLLDTATLYAFTTEQTLLAIDVVTGDLRWSRQHHRHQSVQQILLCDNVLLSSWGRSVEALAPESGKLLWIREATDTAYDEQAVHIYCEHGSRTRLVMTSGSHRSEKLVPSSGHILSSVALPKNAISIASQDDSPDVHRVVSFGAKAISLQELNSLHGSQTVLRSATWDGSAKKPSANQVLASQNNDRSVYLWVQDERLLAINLNLDSFGGQSEIISDAESLIRLDLEHRGVSLVRRKDGSAIILRILKSGAIEQVSQFSTASSASRFAAVVDTSGTLHIARLAWSRTLRLATVDTVSFSLEIESSKPVISGQTVPLDLSKISAGDTFSFALYPHETRKLLPDFHVLFSSSMVPLQSWNGTKLSWEVGPARSSLSSLPESELKLVSTTNAIEMRIIGDSGERALWRMNIDETERIQALAQQASETMLSPGRVNMDRSSSLKYRNANLLAVVVSDSTSKLSIRLLSSDNGNEARRVDLPFSFDPTTAVKIALVEDWIVCTYRTRDLEAPSHILVSTYLSQPNEAHPPLPQTRIFASSKSYHVEGFTNSALGVASRDCILSDSLGQLVVLPRRILNPHLAPTRAIKHADPASNLLEILPNGNVLGRQSELTAPDAIVARSGHRESEALLGLPLSQEPLLTLRPSGSFDALNNSFSRTQVVTVLGSLLLSLFVARLTARKRTVRSTWIE